VITLDRSRVTPFLKAANADEASDRALEAHRRVLDASGAGGDMLGWRTMLLRPDLQLVQRIQEVAAEIRAEGDVLLCIGIGGSYLGAQAVIDALTPQFGRRDGPEVVFAGHHLSPAYHAELLESLAGRRVYVNVISKSGTTLEPALAFRFARRFLLDTGADATRRIIATTDERKGVLHDVSEARGYRTFVVPDDVGGRFSVLTPVGLLPIAAGGVDTSQLVEGAARAADDATRADSGHPALAYASDRAQLHADGFDTEILAVMEPRLRSFGSWWQQLFGESEGKNGRGLFPTVAQYTTDLHSLGQYVQEGPRNLVETFLLADGGPTGPVVEAEPGDPDQLNYLAGRSMMEINRVAFEATAAAHAEGGVPNWTFTLGALDSRTLGEAIYMFEHAVAVSAYLLGVNPFDQPGVEAYKVKMFDLLGRS
jgi:glucose-6-phosphate isomerase